VSFEIPAAARTERPARERAPGPGALSTVLRWVGGGYCGQPAPGEASSTRTGSGGELRGAK
jgi:hypothetical protein